MHMSSKCLFPLKLEADMRNVSDMNEIMWNRYIRYMYMYVIVGCECLIKHSSTNTDIYISTNTVDKIVHGVNLNGCFIYSSHYVYPWLCGVLYQNTCCKHPFPPLSVVSVAISVDRAPVLTPPYCFCCSQCGQPDHAPHPAQQCLQWQWGGTQSSALRPLQSDPTAAPLTSFSFPHIQQIILTAIVHQSSKLSP